ncbi:hypothetical protein AcdelDRAFT_2769 [Acidovorax delafieldii 2AN]|uniref:Uncharacterized protein n=1 Tax=Acidovorax delafieldii 2AN TaxID=573060 RepID=C5T789_ACIDE|nr:hypothetical protein AcdelDRAFT_2769 [Acidovorax delafieldii 2AN]
MLLAGSVAQAVIADKAYDVRDRVVRPSAESGKGVVIPYAPARPSVAMTRICTRPDT